MCGGSRGPREGAGKIRLAIAYFCVLVSLILGFLFHGVTNMLTDVARRFHGVADTPVGLCNKEFGKSRKKRDQVRGKSRVVAKLSLLGV